MRYEGLVVKKLKLFWCDFFKVFFLQELGGYKEEEIGFENYYCWIVC